VHRRGFRFIGKVVSSEEVVNSQRSVASREEERRQEQNGQSSTSRFQGFESEEGRPIVNGQTPDARPQTLDTSISPASSRFPSSIGLVIVLLVIVTGLTVQYLFRPTLLSPQSSVLITRH
jgi:hypothetical protein